MRRIKNKYQSVPYDQYSISTSLPDNSCMTDVLSESITRCHFLAYSFRISFRGKYGITASLKRYVGMGNRLAVTYECEKF